MAEKRNVNNVDLYTCETEPIHIPGKIQPHGVLIGIRPDTKIIEMISANTEELFSVKPEELLGRPITCAFGNDIIIDAKRLDHSPDMTGGRSVQPGLIKSRDREWNSILHHSGGLDILELEPHVPPDETFLADFYQIYNEKLSLLENAADVETLFRQAAVILKQITGFERVWVYQFDDDWNGCIVEEKKEPHLPSYLGLHYPASDIPSQARALYTKNRLRFITDMDAEPAPVIPTLNPLNNEPLDLSMSVLRAISPVHIEYMQNMGVTATLTVSLIKQNTLIGLISCHDHRGPRFVPFEIRRACELIGHVTSSALTELTAQRQTRIYLQTGRIIDAICLQLHENTRIKDALFNDRYTLLDLLSAGGAAIVRRDEIETLGKTPSRDEIYNLVQWLRENCQEEFFITHHLSAAYEKGKDITDTASGILAFNLSFNGHDWVIWFRGEVLQTVTWGGNPDKSMEINQQTGRIHPRKSFEKWKQAIRKQSLHWDKDTVNSVRPFWSILIRTLKLADYKKQLLREKELAREAQKASVAKSTFLANMSHEIRTPMNGVLGVLQLLQAATIDEEHKEYIDMAIRASDRLLHLLSDILDISRIENGNILIRSERFRLMETLNDVIELHKPIADQSSIELRTEFDDGLPDMVVGDATRLQQVLINLIGNAIKFTEKGTVTLEAHPLPPRKDNRPRVLFSVHDTGVGIPDEKILELFEPFVQGSAGYTRDFQGAGLGLPICKKLVRLMGGSMVVESEPGSGTSIYFTTIFADEDAETKESLNNKISKPDAKSKKRVLVAEDDDLSGMVTAKHLEKWGFSAVLVEDGLQALEALRKEFFDIVLMDIQMPSLDGISATRAIRNGETGERNKNIPIIAMTAYAMERDREEFLEAGMNDYIAKPLKHKQLEALVKRILQDN